MNYESKFHNKSSSVNQREDEGVANGLNDNPWDFQQDGFPQLCEQVENICQIEQYNIMMYVRGKHPQLNIGWTVHSKYGLGCTTNVGMAI